jgi:NAD(P)-dependent dehydrogenase (short-subunit alcohol dehydrogenase family)
VEVPRRLAGRVALVTGAGTGIGRAIAVRLAREGAAVAVADIDGEAAGRTVAALRAGGAEAEAFRADVADPASVEDLAAAVLGRFERIDVLVNNAGINGSQPLFEVTAEEWDRVLNVNARGTFLLLQAVARTMRERGGGRIVNLASIAAKGFRRTGSIPYAASKAAVVVITRLAAEQLARDGITVNAICPGPTRSDVYAGIASARAEAEGVTLEEAYRALDAHVPLGRSNEPEDVAAAAAFLASDDARNVTGQSLNVDGGIIFD